MAPNSWLAVPPPIRSLFDLFPLATLPAEPLPSSSNPPSSLPQLFLFARPAGPAAAPSPNPSCLKWQTVLRIARQPFAPVPSSNHASPSGALPFLLLPGTSAPLTGAHIARFAGVPAPPDRAAPYAALLSHAVRPAWLYSLYLLPANTALLGALYLPASPLLQPHALRALRRAASAEILRATRRPSIDPKLLLDHARCAFDALSVLLDEHEWFFAADAPGLFDADVFAYTCLILDDALGWADDALRQCLSAFPNLVRHKDRLYRRCWPE